MSDCPYFLESTYLAERALLAIASARPAAVAGMRPNLAEMLKLRSLEDVARVAAAGLAEVDDRRDTEPVPTVSTIPIPARTFREVG